MTRLPALLVAIAACTPELPDPPNLMDTGWFAAQTEPVCAAEVLDTTPRAGANAWFWRDALTVKVAARDAFTARLIEATGREIATTVTWDDAGLSFTVGFEGGLAAETAHVLQISSCAGMTEVPFTTSHFGTPLVGGPEALAGATWALDLVSATWEQPARLGGIIGLYFDTPVLVGVEWVGQGRIDLLGAPGYADYQGRIRQDDDLPSWDLPMSDFSEAPYFANRADLVVLDLSGSALPIHDFALSGTISADGAEFGGGHLSGIGDTRQLGALLLQPNNPNAVCNLAAGLGVPCLPCPDDAAPYCLAVSLSGVTGQRLDGVQLERVSLP